MVDDARPSIRTPQRLAHYLVIDLEATCADDRSVPRHEMEVIEIGAVMACAATLQPVGEFQAFVRPFRNPQLTPFCTELTGIRQEQVDGAELFPAALARLLEWGRAYAPYRFCSWGGYDQRQFEQDCMYHKVAYPFDGDHMNLKILFGERVGRRPMGVAAALRWLGLAYDGRPHRGIDDARNIVRLLPTILGPRGS